MPRSSASAGIRYRTRGQERRDHRYELKLSASEHTVLMTAAGRDSLTLAAYLVKAGLDRAEHRTAPVGAVQREMAARLIELADFVSSIQTSLSQAETRAWLHRDLRSGFQVLHAGGAAHRRGGRSHPAAEAAMIGRVLKRGRRVYGLLWYLYSPGTAFTHSNPHLVAGWRHPAGLEPPLRDNGKRDFRRLTSLLEQPLILLDDQAPAKPVWHCTVRAAPGDPDLGDGAWMRIAAEIMHRTGLSRYGEEGKGVRWVAVHHGENHIHIAAVLARQDGRRARLDNDYYRIQESLRDLEKEYGLQVVARADRTAAKRPTRAEQEKAARAGRAEPPRVTLQRQVAAAAAGNRSEAEFFAALDKRGLLVRLRHSTHNPGEVTGYAAGLDGDTTAAGDQIWYGGGKLAPDLSLPKLRRRWPEPGEQAHRQHDAAGGCGHGFTCTG